MTKITDEMLPMCAACGRQVERMKMETDHLACVNTYTVQCHGETESMELTAMQIAMAGKDGISEGVAFKRQRIEAE